MKVFVPGLSVCLFLVLGVSGVMAQANLEVNVVSQGSGTAVVGASVVLTNAQIGLEQRSLTNAVGKARFTALSTAGSYVIAVEESAALGAVRSGEISLRSNADRSVTLAVASKASVAETIEVTAGASVAEINTVNAEVSSSLSQEEIETIPIEGRDVTRSLFRLPNVTQATGFYPEAPNVSINGANSLYANYMIDGLDNNENFLGGQKFAIPVGFARDVTVLTNNYSVEFGRTGNGIINVTTRSGGNALDGEVFYLTRPGDSIDSKSPFAQRDLSGNFVKDGFKRNQFGFGLGGPVRQDQTFFYLNAEFMRDDKDNLLTSPQLGVVGTVAGKNEFNLYSGKIDQFWTDRFSSTLRANLGDVAIESQGGGLEGGITFPSASSTQDRESLLIASNNVWALDTVVPETNLQLSRFRWNYGRANNGKGASAFVLGPTGEAVAYLGHPGYVFDDIEETIQLQQKFSATRNRHNLKAGFELLSADFELQGGGNVDGNYLVQLTAAQLAALRARNLGTALGVNDLPRDVQVLDYSVELQPKAFGATQDIYGVYFEDLFAVTNRLNVTAGARYDVDSLSEGGSDSKDSDNIAPRLSFNYLLNERSSFRGGYGLFYEKIVYAIYSDALQQNSTSTGFRNQIQQLVNLGILPSNTNIDKVLFDGNLSASYSNVPFLNGPRPDISQRERIASNERRILNPNGYENPYTQQTSLGYQIQVQPNTLFYVDLMHTHSYHLFRLRDLNAPTAYTINPSNVVVRTPAQADATRPVAPAIGGARSIVVSESEGESKYRAASFNWIKDRGGLGRYGYRVSYTRSKLENNTEDINFKAQDANDFNAEWGPSINDRRHVISTVFSWYPINDVSVSLAGLFQSGQPINRIPDSSIYGTTDLNGDGRSFGAAYVGNSDRQPGFSRNSDRLPWSEVLDLGLEYRPSFLGGRVEVRADIFNVLDEENLSGYSNNATQSNQIQIGRSGLVEKNYGPPRQFQFGVRYLF